MNLERQRIRLETRKTVLLITHSYEQAAALAREIGLRPLLAQCHLGPGPFHRAAGRHELTREQFAAAIGMFREMDMRPWLERTDAEMRELA